MKSVWARESAGSLAIRRGTIPNFAKGAPSFTLRVILWPFVETRAISRRASAKPSVHFTTYLTPICPLLYINVSQRDSDASCSPLLELERRDRAARRSSVMRPRVFVRHIHVSINRVNDISVRANGRGPSRRNRSLRRRYTAFFAVTAPWRARNVSCSEGRQSLQVPADQAHVPADTEAFSTRQSTDLQADECELVSLRGWQDAEPNCVGVTPR